MKIEIIPYEPMHAYAILERNVREEDIWLSKFPDWDKWVKGWRNNGPAFTLVVDGEIVGCAGVVLMEWSRGEAWTLLSSLFYKYKKTTFKAIKNVLDSIIRDKKLRRVQAVIYEGTEKVCGNFLEHLGFEWEGTHRKFGPNGENVHIYGRIMG